MVQLNQLLLGSKFACLQLRCNWSLSFCVSKETDNMNATEKLVKNQETLSDNENLKKFMLPVKK